MKAPNLTSPLVRAKWFLKKIYLVRRSLGSMHLGGLSSFPKQTRKNLCGPLREILKNGFFSILFPLAS